LVSQLSDNKQLVDIIGVEVSDETFADFNDPALVSILQKFSLSMTAQHSIISNVVSEIKCIKMTISDVQASVASHPPPPDLSSFPSLSQPSNPKKKPAGPSGLSGNSGISGISALDSRRPLKQPPLGPTDPWNNVEKRRARKKRTHVEPSQSEFESESESAPPR
jgi:hypothetical protein